MLIEGGCHCGIVRYQVSLPSPEVEISTCDCSICAMTGYQHLIVDDAAFQLVDGRRETSTYRFGTGTARHIFCTQCGIKSFYRPRNHPDGWSINYRCLDDGHGLRPTFVSATADASAAR